MKIDSQARYRSELKFVCSEIDLKKIEAAVSAVCFKDEHGDNAGNYDIRSLYFDTVDGKCYFECKAGVDYRKKYRIRIYDGSDDYIRLECKIGLHGKKRKEADVLPKDRYERLIEKSLITSEHYSRVLNEFIINQNCGLIPKVVVGYTRTAYTFPIGNVRITFDRNISAIQPDMFLNKNSIGIPVLAEGLGVLEVKFDDYFPPLLRQILHGFDLRKSSFSKYIYCVDAITGVLNYEMGETPYEH